MRPPEIESIPAMTSCRIGTVPVLEPPVPRVVSSRRTLVVAGLGERAPALAQALSDLPVDVRVHEDFADARDAIDTAVPLCVVLDANTDVGRELCLDATLVGGSADVPMIGLVAEPSGVETIEAFALGVDDIVGMHDLDQAARKMRALLAGGAAPIVEHAPRVLVADPNRRRRAQLGGQMRHMGMRVRFALDHTEVRYEPEIRLVIASAWLPTVGAVACLREFRRQRGASRVPWVFVGTSPEVDRLAGTLGSVGDVAYHRVDSDPEELVATANALLRPCTSTRRRSARIPFETPVMFDVAGGWSGVWGCSSDLSMGGIFVRTLTAPPVGSSVTVTFGLPTRATVVIEGVVAWRVEARDAAGHAPGFGLQFPEPMDATERAVLETGFRRLLSDTARARMSATAWAAGR